jgi:diguanylate cyclase (GGDEF)-like protein
VTSYPGESLQAERDHAVASAQTALRHATRLARVLTVLAEPASLDDLVDRVLSTLSELFGADVVSLLMLDAGGGLRHLAALGIPEDDAPPGLRVNDPTAEEAVRRRAPVRGEPRQADAVLRALGVRNGLWLPVLGQEHPLGVLRLFRCHDEPLADRDVEMLGAITFRIALAVEQARLHAATREQASTMAELYEIAKTMAETFDFDEVFGRIAKAALARLDAREMSLLRFDGDRATVVRTDSDGRRPAETPGRGPLSPDAVHRLVAELAPDGVLVVPDVRTRPELAALAPADADALLIAAHRRDEAVSTALAVAGDRRRAFGPDDRAFLSGLADVAALALRNARLYEQARRAAERDSLTGLRNRRVFWEDLRAELRAASPALPLAIAVLDVDDFKQVNDRHGHTVGDGVLCHVADRLQRSVRQVDRVYRVGGEEFVAVLPGCDRQAAAEVLRRAAGAVGQARAPLPVVTVSVGIAVAADPALSGETLFRAADRALYQAKRRGKNQVAVAGGPVVS